MIARTSMETLMKNAIKIEKLYKSTSRPMYKQIRAHFILAILITLIKIYAETEAKIIENIRKAENKVDKIANILVEQKETINTAQTVIKNFEDKTGNLSTDVKIPDNAGNAHSEIQKELYIFGLEEKNLLSILNELKGIKKDLENSLKNKSNNEKEIKDNELCQPDKYFVEVDKNIIAFEKSAKTIKDYCEELEKYLSTAQDD
ncbi:hypothetical protein NEIG_01585 [Nematocida sp. ERTm5]|nr:hypothetical protein NEIG_01585 [Nematocida sp. ERTm5]